MCLPATFNIYVFPNERAKTLGKFLLIILVGMVGMAIVSFVGTRYYEGVLVILLAMLGALCVRSEGYAFSQLMCFKYMCGFSALWAYIALILYAANSSVYVAPKSKGARVCLALSLMGVPLFYTAACIIAHMITKELQRIIESALGMEQGFGAGGGLMGYGAAMPPGATVIGAPSAGAAPAAAAQPGNYRFHGSGAVGADFEPQEDPYGRVNRGFGAQARPQSQPASQPQQQGGFRAFAGTGHRLGD